MAGLSFKGSELLGGSIRQELDALWAEMRRLQPVPGAGQRAEYGPHGVRFTMEQGPPPCDVCDRPGACCILGACAQLKQGDCLSAGGTWTECARCEPNPCEAPPPPPTGACCDAAGACTVETEAACTAAEGTYQGDGTVCDPNPCGAPPPPATGACCAGDGTCSVTTAAACSGASGMYQGDGTTCSPNPCSVPPPPLGGCCVGLLCGLRTASACAAEGGIYLGDFTSCPPGACGAPPTGSCCNQADWSCTTTTAAACAYTWTEAGNCGDCAPPPPPATGSCCAPFTNACSVSTQSTCAIISGTWTSGGVCQPDPCGAPPPTGRCCHGDGSCSVTAAAACVGALEVWAAGEDCTTSAAMCFGACCFPQGCMVFDAAGCAAMGGSFNGNGTTCQPDPCVAPPPTGSCCAPFTNACSVSTQSTCAIISGTWTNGGVCQPDPCVPTPPPPVTGRCCAADGSCSMTTQAACAGIAWLENFTCATPCPQPPTGSCCVSGGTCVDALAPGSAGTAIGGGVCEANQNYIAGVFCAARSCLGGCCWFHPSLGNICAVQGATPINNEFDCNFSSGTTFYAGGDCFSCTQHFTAEYPGGACCDLLGGCTLTRVADCVGLWLPDDVCWQDGCPSPSTGACCRMLNGLPDCHLDTAANCDATGGQFTPNTACADVLCPPQREIVGACCDAAGLCFDGATIQTCASTSTFYAGLNCVDAMCVPFTG